MRATYFVFVRNGKMVFSIEPGRHSLGSLEKADDGYYYYWVSCLVPVTPSGFIPAWILRGIADELDRLNKAWDAEISAYFDIQQFKVKRPAKIQPSRWRGSSKAKPSVWNDPGWTD